MSGARDGWANPALALALCGAAGLLCASLRLPLPWMIGPLAAMAACNFAGAALRAPRVARPAGQVVIGTALGLYFTPAVVREVASHGWLLATLGVSAVLLGAGSGWILARVGGVDRTTAFFASVPGGATEMTVLGERFGARVDRIALAQSLRILVVVVLVPFALTYAGVHGADPYVPGATALDWGGLGILLAVALAAGLLLAALRMPNAFMFGPLAAVIAMTALEIRLSAMPVALSNAAQLLIGCALGQRFARRSFGAAPRFVSGVLASVLAAVLAAAGFAALLSWAIGLPLATLVLASAPGGIAEMCITAKVLQLGVPLVTAAHVTRVLILIAATGPLYRAAQRFTARSQP